MLLLQRHVSALTVLLVALIGHSWREGIALRLPSLYSMRSSITRSGEGAMSGDAEQSDAAHGHGWRGMSSSTDFERIGLLKDSQKDFTDGDDWTIRNHWALLVAGSSGWFNYRHQADVCHAYQLLLRGGLRPAHMVVMMYDDIAYDIQNPFPGQVFNAPGGPNVYDGVRVDYSGADVNAATFLAVLAGNASAVPPGSGSGRVIASGPYDRIFVFYSDHGSPGVLGMPSGSFLYADQLVAALQRKHARGGYKEAVLYVEACESGSMFEGLLPPDIAVYATTASNAFESSWGTYCPGMTPGPSPLFSTCLGDLYSVAWMENAELCDLSHETLMTQYDIVRNRTSRNYTYTMGSHVMQYGSLVITREVAGDYQGMRNRGGGGDHPDGDAASCRAGPGPHPSPSPSPYPSSSSFSSSALTSTSTSHRRDDVSAGGGDEGAVRGAVGTLLRRGGDGDDAVDAAAAAAAAAAIAAGAGTQMDTVAAGEGEGAASREDTMQGAQSWRGRRQGRRRRAAEAEAEAEAATATAEAHLRMRQSGSLEQRDADLAPLRYRQVYGRTPEDRHEAQVALEREVSRRKAVDAAALATATSLLNHHPELTLKVAAAASLAAAKPTNAAVTTTTPGNTLYSSDASNGGLVTMLAKELTNGPMGRPAPGRPLVDDWDCLRAMVAAWGDVCGPMDQYTMRHTRLLANLCNAGLAPALLAQSLKNAVAAGFGGEGVGGEGVGRIF